MISLSGVQEKFLHEFQVCLNILYIFASPSAENREKFVHLGRLFLPTSSRPVSLSLSMLRVTIF